MHNTNPGHSRIYVVNGGKHILIHVPFICIITCIMKGTKVQTLGGRAVAGAWLVAWAIMAMGAIINTHAHR